MKLEWKLRDSGRWQLQNPKPGRIGDYAEIEVARGEAAIGGRIELGWRRIVKHPRVDNHSNAEHQVTGAFAEVLQMTETLARVTWGLGPDCAPSALFEACDKAPDEPKQKEKP